MPVLDDLNSYQDSEVLPASRLGLGLVGAGAFGEFCLKAYSAMKEISIVAIADIDSQRASELAPHGAKIYREYTELLTDQEVSIVAINTPPFLHGKMIRMAAEAGKHIFVEKPLAINLEEALQAAEAVHSANVQLGIDYVLRHHPIHLLAAKVIQSQALGKFHHWSLENFATNDTLLPDHWFWDQSKSGGIFVEHGVHFFDLCNYFTGRVPTDVSGYSQEESAGRLDRVCATVKYGDDILATFYHSFNRLRLLEQTTIRLNFSRGHILIEGWIPTQLSLAGLVDEDGLATLRTLFKANLQVEQRFHNAGTFSVHGGMSEQIVAEVSATASAPDRQKEYQRAIQAGMRKLVAAIRSEYPIEIGIDEGILSLAIALAASEGDSRNRFIPPQ
jgi:predicted dehydrogenase